MARVVYPPSPHIVQNSRELSVKGVSAPPLIGGLPSTGGPGCAISRRRGYILQSRTLSHDWERAGDWVEHERRFTYELYQQSLRAYEERDPAQSSPHPAEGTGRNALCGVFLLAGGLPAIFDMLQSRMKTGIVKDRRQKSTAFLMVGV